MNFLEDPQLGLKQYAQAAVAGLHRVAGGEIQVGNFEKYTRCKCKSSRSKLNMLQP